MYALLPDPTKLSNARTMTRAKAEELVEILNRDETEGWTYSVNCPFPDPDRAIVRVYDELGIFTGYL